MEKTRSKSIPRSPSLYKDSATSAAVKNFQKSKLDFAKLKNEFNHKFKNSYILRLSEQKRKEILVHQRWIAINLKTIKKERK